jgi:hypothetical protein
MKTPTLSVIEEYVSDCVDSEWPMSECRTDQKRFETHQHNVEVRKDFKRLVKYYRAHPEEFWICLADYQSGGKDENLEYYEDLLKEYMK